MICFSTPTFILSLLIPTHLTHSIPEIDELCGVKTGLLKNDQFCFLIKMYTLEKEKETWLT